MSPLGAATTFALAAPEAKDLALILVDVDHFKPLNDTFGHLVGDACLKAVATALAKRSRPSDLVARIGGDEFAVLAYGRSPAEWGDLTAGLCDDIAALRPEGAPRGARVSVSVGAARRCAHETSAELIRRADAALYRAKDAGRGCALWARDEEETTPAAA